MTICTYEYLKQFHEHGHKTTTGDVLARSQTDLAKWVSRNNMRMSSLSLSFLVKSM